MTVCAFQHGHYSCAGCSYTAAALECVQIMGMSLQTRCESRNCTSFLSKQSRYPEGEYLTGPVGTASSESKTSEGSGPEVVGVDTLADGVAGLALAGLPAPDLVGD